ncbi:hypothetical protein SBA1_90082 [Candidatus Sulfotelmatobacter kueseliae]|uniref:Uncharacterized protein n=1 Tax=Candidatus Sulfotelmatobacter kueseliae TaxID=2042962 RepID=A0A2U3LAK2_9BACT|nr:hypothetical protein SBA1_90082 [Candidatus Sulfotelmatobacter kueseliae]
MARALLPAKSWTAANPLQERGLTRAEAFIALHYRFRKAVSFVEALATGRPGRRIFGRN